MSLGTKTLLGKKKEKIEVVQSNFDLLTLSLVKTSKACHLLSTDILLDL